MSVSVAEVDQALRLAHRERAARGDLLADGRRARDRLAGRHDLVDEADALGLRGASGPGRSGSAPWPAPAPTTRGSRCVPPAPGVTARRTSGRPSRARSEAIRRSQHSASSSPPPSALPSIAAMVGIGSSASRRATPDSSSCRARPRRTALGLELADVRAGREGPLAAARSRRPPGRRRARRPRASPSAVAELLEQLPRDEVERRVDELELRDAAQLEVDRAPLTRAAAEVGRQAHRAGRVQPRGPSSAGRRRRAAGSPSGPSTSRSTSMPGATSIRTRPSSSRANTARSVM